MSLNELVKTYNPKNLLISLYHYHHSHSPNDSKTDHLKGEYNELNQFREQLEEAKSAPHHQPYQAGRKKALFYQIIFYGLGLIFLFITLFMYTQTMNWAGSLFFVNYTATKTVLCLFTFALSCISFSIGYSISIEKEAVNQLIDRAQAKMRHILRYERAQFAVNHLSFRDQFKKSLLAKQAFHDANEKVKESKKITFTLLEHINQTVSLEKKDKEHLYNQAILELNDKLHFIIFAYKDKLEEFLKV